MGAAHELGQLFLGDFDEELTGLDGGEHILSECSLLDPVGKAFGNAVVHIGLDQGTPDFLGGFRDVGFGDGGFPADALERLLEAVTEVLEHGEGKGSPLPAAPELAGVSAVCSRPKHIFFR